LLARAVEIEIVGNEALAFLAEELLDDRMAAADDQEFSRGIEFWACVSTIGRKFCKASEDVKLGDGGCGAAEAGSFGGDAGADVDVELALDFKNAFIGGEDFAFVVFKLAAGESLGVDKSLLAFVIGRSELEIGFRNFDVVAKDVIEADFERVDSGAFTLAFFHGGNDLLAVLAEVSEFVKFSVIAGADHAGVGGESGRIVGNGAIEEFADVGELINFKMEMAKEFAAAGGLWCKEIS